jgi:hypothetical protein
MPIMAKSGIPSPNGDHNLDLAAAAYFRSAFGAPLDVARMSDRHRFWAASLRVP